MKYNLYKFIYVVIILALLGFLVYLIQVPEIARFFGLIGIISILSFVHKFAVSYIRKRFPVETVTEKYRKDLRTAFERHTT